jgi:aminoglycoside phosphotransferase (APT) family kinase protein
MSREDHTAPDVIDVREGEAFAASSPMPTQSPGFLSRAQAGARYAERSGRSAAELTWYVCFGTFKMAVVLQRIYVRYHRGQTRDPRFANLAAAAEGLFELAAARRP